MASERLKESPEYVRLSLAAAMTLRLVSGRFYRDARLYCVNLLLTYTQGCAANCSYCGLSRGRGGDYQDKSFIRVDWPLFPLETVIARLKNGYVSHVERVCISMITHRRAVEDTIKITKSLKKETNLPISLLINPTIVNGLDLIALKEEGADMVGVAIDAATEELFELHRGVGVKGPHKWEKYWATLEGARDIFGKGKFGAHLIVGLGEKEYDMVQVIQRVKDLGGRTHLFSFYPERGSALEGKAPADVGQFRRIQLARFLIDHDIVKVSQMRFDSSGRILSFGLNGSELENVIRSGEPFRTSGCPGRTHESACNRPFGDGPPSDIRSFPFRPNKGDIERIKRQLNNGIPR
jgi:biotin synthase